MLGASHYVDLELGAALASNPTFQPNVTDVAPEGAPGPYTEYLLPDELLPIAAAAESTPTGMSPTASSPVSAPVLAHDMALPEPDQLHPEDFKFLGSGHDDSMVDEMDFVPPNMPQSKGVDDDSGGGYLQVSGL